jgi:hypothetical protein
MKVLEYEITEKTRSSAKELPTKVDLFIKSGSPVRVLSQLFSKRAREPAIDSTFDSRRLKVVKPK